MTAEPVIIRRPERPDDATFRFELFCASRSPGEDLAGIDAPLRDALLRQQFTGQTATYRADYPSARFEIVELDNECVGRIVVDATADVIRLVDIALVPAARGRGIGTALVKAVLAEAGGRPTRLRVGIANGPALRLYLRLGFVIVSQTEMDLTLEARPAPPCDARPMPDRLRLPLTFDPAPLAAEVAALAGQDWIAHFVTQHYDGDWSVIPLRGKAGATHPVMMIHADPACRDFADTPFLAACPAIRTMLTAFDCPLEVVRLMRLGPGAIIKTHVDHELDVARGAVRFHVPIVTSPDVIFTLNGTRVTMQAGSVWYLRLSDPHGVENKGTTDRVHLVIDTRVDPWVTALLARAMDEMI